MNRRDNFGGLMLATTGLAFALLVTFQVYQWREPARLQRDAAADLQASRDAGEELFGEQCARCHGPDGEGGVGPTLASNEFLGSVADAQLFSLVRSGVPGTAMPAWAQDFGGPLTNQEIEQVVAFVRSWEGEAEQARAPERMGRPERGGEIFAATCSFCHGAQGRGGEQAPPLNDPELLAEFDDDWFRQTITEGRPSRGMPTWGTVLSPQDVDDVVAFLGTWREAGPTGEESSSAAGADAVSLFLTYCSPCHGASGEGGFGPALVGNEYVASQDRDQLEQLMAQGRPGTPMAGFEDRLSGDQLSALADLLASWQP